MNARALDREVSVIIRSVVQVARDTGYKGPRWPIVRAALDNGAIVNTYQRWTDADVEALLEKMEDRIAHWKAR